MTANRRWIPYAIVLAVGLALGALQFALDNRDPLVFTIPILVLTAVALVVMAISGRGEAASNERVAVDQGLRYDGVGPLPSVTPILAGVRAPAPVFSARLPDRGPRVRLAEVRGRRVSVVESPADDVDGARTWLDAHPLRPEAAVEDGLLVTAVGRDVDFRTLLALTGELRDRL